MLGMDTAFTAESRWRYENESNSFVLTHSLNLSGVRTERLQLVSLFRSSSKSDSFVYRRLSNCHRFSAVLHWRGRLVSYHVNRSPVIFTEWQIYTDQCQRQWLYHCQDCHERGGSCSIWFPLTYVTGVCWSVNIYIIYNITLGIHCI